MRLRNLHAARDSVKLDNRGFTIIEVLVVASLISIVSSIAVSGYRGSLVAARNSRRIRTVQQYIRVLQAYRIDNGQYPLFNDSIGFATCLGSSYEDTNGDGSGDCRFIDDNGAGLFSEIPAFSDELRQYFGEDVPLPSFEPVPHPTRGDFFGASYSKTSSPLDGRSGFSYVNFVLEGDGVDCRIGPLMIGPSTDWKTAPDGRINSGTSGQTFTWCFVALDYHDDPT